MISLSAITVSDICEVWERLTCSERHQLLHELDLRDSGFRELVKNELDLLDEGDLEYEGDDEEDDEEDDL